MSTAPVNDANEGPAVLALVPARGGSKGVPRKNIRSLAGRPLLAWTLAAARACERVDRVIVSTDDEEIAEVAREFGAEVPFMRPAEHSRDDTPDLPVYLHALDWLEEHESYVPDFVAWLRPTTPLRLSDDISAALDLIEESRAQCVRSVCEVDHHPYWMKRIESTRLVPFLDHKDETAYPQRQSLPTLYRLNGVVDVIRHHGLDRTQLFAGEMHGYVMPRERSIDIDTELDFRFAELATAESND